MIGSLFHLMAKSGTGYPELYGRSRIVEGGSADIHYNSGYKSPDFSLYEVKDGGGGVSDDQDSSTPTVVFEVAYTQHTRNVALEAARHICLTRGEVRLVVAIDIVHKRGVRPRELESVTWSHWEEDVLKCDVVEHEDDEVDEVYPERGDEENDEDYVLPPATAFTAVVAQPGGRKRYRIRAEETAKWQVRH
jgi:hypothetical protein